jgi:hypothetical protein
MILAALCLSCAPIGLAHAVDDQPTGSPSATPAAGAPAAASPAAPAAAGAAAAAPAGPPAAAPEMTQLNLFKGNIHCTGKQSASQFGPEHPTLSVVHGHIDLNGFWLTLRYNERKTRENPSPFHALYQIGYDPSAKQYLLVEADNFGGRGTAASSGWDGDRLVFTGDYIFPGGKLGTRDTFTRNNDKVTGHLAEIQGSDGSFVTLDEESCALTAPTGGSRRSGR